MAKVYDEITSVLAVKILGLISVFRTTYKYGWTRFAFPLVSQFYMNQVMKELEVIMASGNNYTFNDEEATLFCERVERVLDRHTRMGGIHKSGVTLKGGRMYHIVTVYIMVTGEPLSSVFGIRLAAKT